MTDKVKKLLFIAFPSGEGGPLAVDEEIKFAEMMFSSSVTFGATFSAGEGIQTCHHTKNAQKNHSVRKILN